jgi:hypothetical protein
MFKVPTDVMAFGKHRGKRFEDIPASYLEWALGELDFAGRQWLRRAMESELLRRFPEEDARSDDPKARVPPDAMSDLLHRWYRQVCLRYHPDRGGSTEIMQAMNDAYQTLQKMLKEAAS